MSAHFGEGGCPQVLPEGICNVDAAPILRGRAVQIIPSAGGNYAGVGTVAAADANAIGVAQGCDYEPGASVRVVVIGLTEVYISQAVTQGDGLSVAADGSFYPSNNNVIARAMHDAPADFHVSAIVFGKL